MPREERAGGEVVVNHNQSSNLKPNDKMLAAVCMNCHGMQFAMDSLADEELIEMNFSRRPSRRHPGLRWAADAAAERGDKRIKEILKTLNATGSGETMEKISYPPKQNQK